jgi:hypothetical protein
MRRSKPAKKRMNRQKILKNITRNLLPGARLREQGLEHIITDADHLVRWHLPIRLDTAFQEVPLFAAVSDMHPCLERMLEL